MIGSAILHYRILEKLGEGGMGIVYKAQDTRLDRIVALKFLPPAFTPSEDDRARFLQEAKAASALNHPNVCTIHDIQEVDGRTFIVMEYVEGKTLREARSGIGMVEAAGIGEQIAEGLAAAHAKGIVHRDIKADNIILRPDGRVQIMDFGLAKLPGVSTLTKAGSTVGTTAYLSPEQVSGLEADHRTDIFALGVVMYELLAGTLPFKGSHQAAVMYEIVNVEPPPLSNVRPGVERDLERIVMKCLEKDPVHRYQAVREVAVDLKRFKRDSDGKQVRPPGVAAPRATQGKNVRWMAAGITATVLLAAGVLTLLLLRGRSDVVESLAVLPFENSGGDQNMEYVSDGITESIINGLTRVPELRVIPRSTVFRFKGKNMDPQEAGEKLNVHAVLTGRLVRQGEDLVAQVDLIDVRKQSQVWGQQYRRNARDLLTLQDEITEGASRKLRRSLSVDETRTVTRRYTDNPEAYRAYLQGLYSWNKRRASEIEKAITFFNQAIALDPTFALAYVGLANTYAIQEQYEGKPGKVTYPRAFAAASQALAIDSTLAEAHTTVAFASMGMWNWKRAEQEFTTSISLNPRYPTTYHWYGILLHTLRRHDEAHRAISRAQELDPLSPVIGLNVAEAFLLESQFQRAIQEMQAVLAIDSSFAPAHYRQSRAYLRLGKNAEAYAAATKGVEVSGGSAESLSFLGYVLGKMGRKMDALNIARKLEQRNAEQVCPGYYIARVHAGVGDAAGVFHWLTVDVDNHSGSLIWLPHDGEWDPYRSDPRFRELLTKIGL